MVGSMIKKLEYMNLSWKSRFCPALGMPSIQMSAEIYIILQMNLISRRTRNIKFIKKLSQFIS